MWRLQAVKRRTKINSDVRRVVAYVRVSTEKQASEGNSLEAQTSRLHAYAAAMGLDIVATEVDAGVSASTLERPALQRALARLDAFEAEGILVTKLDRLTRSVRDLADLVDTYFRDTHALISLGESIDTSSAAGRMMLGVLSVIGQWEREAIGERTSAVMQHMREQGAYTGGWPPYGFRVQDGQLVEDAREGEILARAKAFRKAGMSLRSIAASLPPNPRTGKAFCATQIVRML